VREPLCDAAKCPQMGISGSRLRTLEMTLMTQNVISRPPIDALRKAHSSGGKRDVMVFEMRVLQNCTQTHGAEL
jgi:hypothetical protein